MLLNGAYFRQSGAGASSTYARASSLSARPSSLVGSITTTAGTLSCRRGRRCWLFSITMIRESLTDKKILKDHCVYAMVPICNSISLSLSFLSFWMQCYKCNASAMSLDICEMILKFILYDIKARKLFQLFVCLLTTNFRR